MFAFAIPWMESLGVVLIGFLADAIKGLVGKLLVGLGIGFVTASGFNALFASVIAQANIAAFGDTQFQAAVTAMGLPWFVSTLVSAITTKMTLKGLASDSLSFWRMRKAL